LTIAMIIFGIAFKVKEHFINSIWYIFYIAFLLVMAYIGSAGALDIIPFIPASVIVAIVSIAVFFPWGILSGLKKPFIPSLTHTS
ncbi:membrane protein, partial [mine drainage metagenome]